MTKVKILIADDNQIVLNSCGRILEAEGFKIYLAQSADKALEVMNRGALDLVLIDGKMPELDGTYLMRKIKEE